MFLSGFIKKACIADGVAPIADRYFAHPANFTPRSAWIGVLFYAIQIYCDFSGYTDMAIASARLLGYQLPNNFRFPYFAQNVSDFWRRWHISLSSWLRDYLYIPIGGNRGPRWFVYRNIMITMLLGGLWHGAAWTFVIWGALHGIALLVHREWTRLTDGLEWATRAMRWLAWRRRQRTPPPMDAVRDCGARLRPLAQFSSLVRRAMEELAGTSFRRCLWLHCCPGALICSAQLHAIYLFSVLTLLQL